jgi:epoxide hydrolase
VLTVEDSGQLGTDRAFRVDFDADAVADLRNRLHKTRWPERETVSDWSQGAPLAFIQELATYWAREYDFGAAAERMNASPQYTTRIEDLDIHYVHARSPEPDAMPLIITHGWPGTYVEFLDVIGPLTDPVAHGGDARDAFHVVCPSLPGYGFSDRPSTRGRGLPWIADAWATLMQRLGYNRYGAQGGDWGSAVTCVLGESHPDAVLGIHINMPTVPLGPLGDSATEQERQNLRDFEWHGHWGTGYQHQQSSRPQTLGYGLVDSPVGQLAWVVEKFWAWTDCDGHPLNLFTREQLLDNATVYWMTATGASSARLYWEGAGPILQREPDTARAPGMGLVTIPTGCSVFPKEIRRPSRRQAERRFTNIHYWSEPSKGGHFAAFEQPALFVDEVRSSFRPLR